MGKLNAARIVHGGLNGQCVPGEHWEAEEPAWEQGEEIMINTAGAADLGPQGLTREASYLINTLRPTFDLPQ